MQNNRHTLLCNDYGREVSHVYAYEDYVNGTCTMCEEATMQIKPLITDFKRRVDLRMGQKMGQSYFIEDRPISEKMRCKNYHA